MAHALQSFLRPRSIAFVGATERSVWTRFAFSNLKSMGFDGRLHMVNRKGGEVLGHAAVTSLAAIGEPVDIALLMVPSDALAETFPDLKAGGVRNAVVLSSGFAETGDGGRVQQQRLLDTARRHGVRLLGPNCLGFVNFVDRTPVWTMPTRQIVPGSVAVLSQSGALAAQMSYFAQRMAVGLSYMVSTGNEADVDVAQVLDYLVEDPATRCIALFLESVRDPAVFSAAAAKALAARKPVVVLKVGSSAVSSKAAQAHTGSLVGDDRVFDAVCRQYGLVRVESLEDLIITAELMARTGVLRDGGLGLISLSGGLCEIAADRAEAVGVALPELAPATVTELRRLLPDFGTPHNPLDVTGAAMLQPALFGGAVRGLLTDPGFAAIAAVLDLPASADEETRIIGELATELGRAQAGRSLPVLLISHTLRPAGPLTRQIEETAGLNYLACGVHHGVAALGHAFRWSRRVAAAAAANAAPTAAAPLSAARPSSEWETLQYLKTQGVPVIPGGVARDRAEAIEFASTFDAPAVVKIASPDIAHKTEVGGVELNLSGPQAVGDAHDRILDRVRQVRPLARIDGVLVAPMREGGVELFVGTMRDPQWGPVIAVGLGGIFVELLKDTALRRLPVSAQDVQEMLGELRGVALLDGFRGAPAADRAAVADVIARIGDAALALGAELVSLEINPLLVRGARVEALDALALWQDV